MATQTGQGWPRGNEGKELQRAVLPGEQVVTWAQGQGGALLVATDQRALIIKTGGASGQLFGRKVNAWPYQQIVSIDFQTTFSAGWVEIVTAGMQARRGSVMGKEYDAFQADNMVKFVKRDTEAFRQIVATLRERIQQVQTSGQSAAATTASPSIPEQIEQLARLRDAGILSREEFEAKKADLLARM